MEELTGYSHELKLVKSLLIVTSLQRHADLKALQAIRAFAGRLTWRRRAEMMVDSEVWRYAVEVKQYDPKLVFCHPDVLQHDPTTSLYYRGLCALSLKAANGYFGSVDSLERRRNKTPLSREKALRMARTYNTFICSIIKNSTDWTLENGCRTMVATLGISLDGSMRNRIGLIAEQRIRALVLEWVIDHGALVEPALSKDDVAIRAPRKCELAGGIVMQYASDPDISFWHGSGKGRELLAVVEIKGGVDPAGALERYGAATKSFRQARTQNPRCRNFFLSAVFTPELLRRIGSDQLVEKHYDIVELLEKPTVREDFLRELFHYTLRLL